MTRTEQLLHELSLCASEVKRITNPADIVPHFARFARQTQENFFVATLDGSHSVIKVHALTRGLVNRTMIHPREVFRAAIRDNAVSVILGHNHPSGNLEPSPEDLEITRRISEAGKIVGIEVLDHVIVSRNGFASLRESGITF